MNSDIPNRRRFIKGGAALAGLAVGAIPFAKGRTGATETPEDHPLDLSYGHRSHFETSVRTVTLGGVRDIGPGLPPPSGEMGQRLTPLQDSAGIITPASLHFMTGRGSRLPDIDPREHRLMIHGMVDRPLVFTMEELKRLPYVSGIYFVECLGNRARPTHKTVQETHGLTSCAEWTGVPLSLLLKEAGVQNAASWIVAEGAEEVKGASSIPP